eukprot:12546098-Ditylum_brightwellii.AAC.1
MFVDDKTLVCNGNVMDMQAKTLMSIVTHDVVLWDCYIWTTGCLIEGLKTAYGLMIWKFHPSGKPYLTPENKLPNNTVVINQDSVSTSVN